jgi:hypothetical protein
MHNLHPCACHALQAVVSSGRACKAGLAALTCTTMSHIPSTQPFCFRRHRPGSREPDCSDRPRPSSRTMAALSIFIVHFHFHYLGWVDHQLTASTRCLLRTPLTELFSSRSHSSGWADHLLPPMPNAFSLDVCVPADPILDRHRTSSSGDHTGLRRDRSRRTLRLCR